MVKNYKIFRIDAGSLGVFYKLSFIGFCEAETEQEALQEFFKTYPEDIKTRSMYHAFNDDISLTEIQRHLAVYFDSLPEINNETGFNLKDL